MAEVNLLLRNGDFMPKFGTCELPQTFGEVVSASLKRTNELQEIPNCCGGLKALLIKNRKWEMQLKAIFDATLGLPSEGDPMAFPLAGVIGTVLTFSVDWSQSEQVQLTIDATHWDSLGNAGPGGTLVVTPINCDGEVAANT